MQAYYPHAVTRGSGRSRGCATRSRPRRAEGGRALGWLCDVPEVTVVKVAEHRICELLVHRVQTPALPQTVRIKRS